MIKLLRKIRQELFAKGKVSQYLLYASGEIILVVIGILIALGINNKNQERLNREVEQNYLMGLQEEFHTSRAKLVELISVNRESYLGARKILELIAKKDESPSEKQFSQLLYNTFSSDISFNPNNSLLNEMVSSGSLRNISNTDLRILLTNWISTLEDISRQEGELSIQREKVLDMIRTDKNSLRTILMEAGVYDELELPARRHDTSNLSLLNSNEFENNILMFILASYATEEAHYNPLMQDLERILELIAKSIH